MLFLLISPPRKALERPLQSPTWAGVGAPQSLIKAGEYSHFSARWRGREEGVWGVISGGVSLPAAPDRLLWSPSPFCTTYLFVYRWYWKNKTALQLRSFSPHPAKCLLSEEWDDTLQRYAVLRCPARRRHSYWTAGWSYLLLLCPLFPLLIILFKIFVYVPPLMITLPWQ